MSPRKEVVVSPEAVFIVSLLALAVAVMLAATVTLRTVAPPEHRFGEETRERSEQGIPVRVICPTTTLPTFVELTRRPSPDVGLMVLSCAEFAGAPTCEQACVAMPVPLVSA